MSIHFVVVKDLMAKNYCSDSVYRLAQNFGRVNFWRFVPEHAFGREILVDPAKPSCCILCMATLSLQVFPQLHSHLDGV